MEWARQTTDTVGKKVSGVFAWPGEKVQQFRQKIAGVRDRLEVASGHMVRMMAIFVVETVILPIGMLWAMLALAGRSVALPGRGSGVRT
jgi:hypothetical protein